MIESILFFVLGFLSAVLAAMVIAPAIWRRAVFLTRKRIESSVPLTVNELLADKDRLRAEHAMALRKAEMALARQRDVSTEVQARLSNAERDLRDKAATIAARDTAIAGLQGSLEQETARADGLSRDLAETRLELDTVQADLAARSAEVESLQRLLADTEQRLNRATGTIAEREGELERAETRIGELRERLRDAQAKVRESRAEARETAELLKNEKQRVAELDKRLERAIANASDLEVALQRRDKDMERLRERQSAGEADLVELERRAADAERERGELESELGELTVRINRLSKLTGSAEPETVLEAFQARIARLETELAGERTRAAAAEAALEEARAAAKSMPARSNGLTGDEALRDEIGRLSAEIVHMASLIEGDDSRVHALVDDAPPGLADAPRSLADRIKALRAEARKHRSSGA